MNLRESLEQRNQNEAHNEEDKDQANLPIVGTDKVLSILTDHHLWGHQWQAQRGNGTSMTDVSRCRTSSVVKLYSVRVISIF